MMKRWLTSLFLLIALAGGVLAGMPLHSEKMDSRMMGCCQKAQSTEQSPKAAATRLCCALDCSDSTPTPSGASFNFSPSSIFAKVSILKQIVALLLKKEKPVSTVFKSPERELFPQKIQPKYIRHHSFLI